MASLGHNELKPFVWVIYKTADCDDIIKKKMAQVAFNPDMIS